MECRTSSASVADFAVRRVCLRMFLVMDLGWEWWGMPVEPRVLEQGPDAVGCSQESRREVSQMGKGGGSGATTNLVPGSR